MDIHQCSVRFNDNNINQHKAWEYLQHRDMKKYPSYAALIAESVVYFIEQDNTRTENKIIEQENKLIDKIQKCIADALSSEILKQVFNSDKNSEDNIESESNISDVDWDYLCGNDN